MARAKRNRIDTAATVGYDAQLWRMADALRGSMDAAEYKRVDARKSKPRSRDDNFVEEVKTRTRDAATGPRTGTLFAAAATTNCAGCNYPGISAVGRAAK